MSDPGFFNLFDRSNDDEEEKKDEDGDEKKNTVSDTEEDEEKENNIIVNSMVLPFLPRNLDSLNFGIPRIIIHSSHTILPESNGIPVPETTTIMPIKVRPILFQCIICQSNQVQTVNFPCMHACFCIECAKPSLNHSTCCPECREPYQHISMLYPSYIEAKINDLEPPEPPVSTSSCSADEPVWKKQKTN